MGQVLVFEAPRRIAVSDEEVAAPAAGEVLVRTLYSGISAGTELTAYRGTNPYLIKTWDPERRLFTGGGSAERPSYPLVGWGYEEVGQMVEQTTHMFDLARMFLGEAASVHALTTRVPRTGHPECDVDEVSVAQVRFASGAVASFASTHILAASHTVGLHLYAENLAVEIAAGGIAVDRGEGREQIDTPGDATAAMHAAFLDAVRRQDPTAVRSSYADALETHRLTTTARESARAGRVLPVVRP